MASNGNRDQAEARSRPVPGSREERWARARSRHLTCIAAAGLGSWLLYGLAWWWCLALEFAWLPWATGFVGGLVAAVAVARRWHASGILPLMTAAQVVPLGYAIRWKWCDPFAEPLALFGLTVAALLAVGWVVGMVEASEP